MKVKLLFFYIVFFTQSYCFGNIPSNLAVVDSSILSLKLSWDPVTGASSYKLYRSDSTGTNFQFLVNTSQTVYKDSTLTPETKYFYKASSVINGTESALSDSVSGTTRFSNLRVFSLWVAQSDLDSLNSDLPESGKCCYKPAILNVDGVNYNVETRYKGGTDGHWAYTVKSWRIKFDALNPLSSSFITLNLDNPSIYLIEENISYSLLKDFGLAIPSGEMVRMKLNGANQGVHFSYNHDRENEFFSLNNIPIGDLYTEVGYSDAGSLLYQIWDYRGETSASYYSVWEKAINDPIVSSDNYDKLIDLLRIINTVPNDNVIDSLQNILDLEQFLIYYCGNLITKTTHNDYHNLRLYFNPSIQKFQQWPNDPAAWQGSLNIPADWCVNLLNYKVLQNPKINFLKNQKLYELISKVPLVSVIARTDSVWKAVKEDAYTDPLKDNADGIVYSNSAQSSYINSLKNAITNTYNYLLNYLNTSGLKYSQKAINISNLVQNTQTIVTELHLTTIPNSGTAVSSLTFTASGTGNEVNDINSVKLFRDNNLNGLIDFGDTDLGSNQFANDNGQITFTLNDTLLPKVETYFTPYVNYVDPVTQLFTNTKYQIKLAPRTYSYLLSYEFNNNANSDSTFLIYINSPNDILVTNAVMGTPIVPQHAFEIISEDELIATIDLPYKNELIVPSATNFSFISSPSWLSINSQTGIITGTPMFSDLGTDTVEVLISDNFGNSIIHSYPLTVLSENQTPHRFFSSDLNTTNAGICGNGVLNFNGATSYVQIPHSDFLNLNNNFSIEIWFYPTGAGTTNQILLTKQDSYIVMYRPQIKNISIRPKNSSGSYGFYAPSFDNIVNTEAWNHLVITYSGTTMKVYINSFIVLTQSNVTSFGIPSTAPFYFGRVQTSQPSFNGKIDDVRIWNKALTPEEIAYNYENPGFFPETLNLTTDIRANWTFSEGTGSTTADQGPNNLNGTIYSATWDTELYWKKNTYYITQDVRLDSTLKLTIEPGCTIKLADSSSFIFYGPVIANGTEEDPITFTRISENGNWGTFGTNNPLAGASEFSHLLIEHAKDDTVDGQFYIGALSLYNISSDVSNSTFRFNKGDDAINRKYAVNSDVFDCIFENNFADNIDYDFTTGKIYDNYFLVTNEGLDSNGDGVDCGTANPEIYNNVFYNLGDKGVSVGEQSFPYVHHNIISNCYFGIASKDLSNPIIENNTIVNNHIGIASYRKKPEFGGSDGQVKNCILWGNTLSDSIDVYSDLTITYSDVQGGYTGTGNFNSDPLFVNPIVLDYHVQTGSPAIDSGDPTSDYSSEPEPNGFRVNVGRFGNTREAAASSSVTSQTIPLNSGFNLVSWSKNTQNDSLLSVFGSILDSLQLVTGFNQGALIYNPQLPNFSNLHTVDHTHGYWIKMSGTDTLEISGSSISNSEPLPLWIGWNLVSYIPNFVDSTTHSLSSILNNLEMVTGFENGALAYDPVLPQFSTLNLMKPNFGYWIKINALDTLSYPIVPVSNITQINNGNTQIFSTKKKLGETLAFKPKDNFAKTQETRQSKVSQAKTQETKPAKVSQAKTQETQQSKIAKSNNSVSETQTPVLKPTNQFVFLYGENVLFNGFPLSPGSEITATDQLGTVCGFWEVSEVGKFGFMAVYKDDPSTQIDEGMTQGEEILVYVNGSLAFSGIIWNEFGAKINLGTQTTQEPEEPGNLLPKEFSLSQNYPNPFNPTTQIKYSLPRESKVSLIIYNILGQEVVHLANEKQEAGFYSVSWNGLDKNQNQVASGVYFFKLKAGDFVDTKKMVLIR